jgi:hypothetical protein
MLIWAPFHTSAIGQGVSLAHGRPKTETGHYGLAQPELASTPRGGGAIRGLPVRENPNRSLLLFQLASHLSRFLSPLLLGRCTGNHRRPSRLAPPCMFVVPTIHLDPLLFLLFFLSIPVQASTQAPVLYQRWI